MASLILAYIQVIIMYTCVHTTVRDVRNMSGIEHAHCAILPNARLPKYPMPLQYSLLYLHRWPGESNHIATPAEVRLEKKRAIVDWLLQNQMYGVVIYETRSRSIMMKILRCIIGPDVSAQNRYYKFLL